MHLPVAHCTLISKASDNWRQLKHAIETLLRSLSITLNNKYY